MKRVTLIAVLLAALLVPAAAHAAGGTMNVGFEDLAAGTTVTDQYASTQGVRFGTPADFGLPEGGGDCGEPPIASPGVSGHSLSIGCQHREFGGLTVASGIELTSERRAISLQLKAVGTDQTVTVKIYAIGGVELDSKTLTLTGDGPVVTVPFTRSTPEIVGVSINGGAVDTGFDDHVFLDNVTGPIEDPTTVTPKFSLTLLQPRTDVVEGSSVTVPVRVNRYNGSVGPVQLNVGDLPSGVDGAQITPNPVPGRDTSQLKISVDAPLAGDRQLTISASKPAGAPVTVGNPVGASVVQTVSVISALSFTDRAAEEIVFTPGCAFSPTQDVTVRGGYRGRIAMSVQVLAGAPQPSQSAEIQATADGDLQFPYPVPFKGPGSGVLRITLYPANATSVVRDVPVRVAAPIAGVSPTSVHTPRAGQEGSLVTLNGEGFCGSANTRVRFGNDQADAPILSRNPQGTQISVRVPRLATTGKIQIIPDITHPADGVLDGPVITVDSYRNVAGFPFHNYTPHLTVDQMTATFGRAATHISVDACGAFTFGAVDCTVITPIPDPWAMIVLALANATMGSDSGGGACFGFSRTTEQLRMQRRTYGGLGNDAATNAFGIPAPGGPSGSVQETINANQLAQLSGEYAGYYLAHAVAGQFTADPGSLRNDLAARLRSNDYPLMSLRTGGTVDELHVVVGYDIEDDPNEPGAYYVDVYDSNQPFVVPGYVQAGKATDSNEDTEGELHKQRVEDSRIHVHANGHWELPSSDMSASSLGNIVVGGLDDPPSHPTLITAKGALKSGVTALFGSAAGTLVGLAARAHAHTAATDPPSTTSQIAVGDRHLYSAPGVLEDDKAKALNATPWVPATGAPTGTEGFLLGGGAGATYDVDLQGGRAGSQTRTVIGDGVVSQVTAPSRAGVTDKLTLTPSDAAVGFSSGKGSVPLSMQTMARGTDGTTRGAAVSLTSGTGGHDSVGFDAGRTTVELTHAGKPATVTLTLSSFGKTLPQTGRISIRVGKGTTTIKPGAWTALRGGTVKVRANGKTKTITLRTSGTAKGAKLTKLSVATKRGKRIASVRVTVPSGVVDGTANVALAITRGKKSTVIATKSLAAGAKGTRTLTWTLPSKAHRGDHLLAIATTVIQRGTQFDSAVSRKTARVRR
ncbi:MAG: hypothetical protein JWQ18_828 [Conexibacter sp.]|nr:hypothetical protein [Conexibacter sp.]